MWAGPKTFTWAGPKMFVCLAQLDGLGQNKYRSTISLNNGLGQLETCFEHGPKYAKKALKQEMAQAKNCRIVRTHCHKIL